VNGNMGGMTERRTTRRYDLSLPIIIRVPAEKTLDQQAGKTRDISTRGLYFVMDQDLQAGSVLDLTLTLPAEVTRGTEVFVHASGKVIRVEPRIEEGNTRMGVAAVIERYDIVRGEAARA
jgi:PilZ domain